MTTLRNAVENKLASWALNAEVNFARKGKEGVKMVRQLWANGSVMVGEECALPNQMIPLNRAIAIYKSGWKVVYPKAK